MDDVKSTPWIFQDVHSYANQMLHRSAHHTGEERQHLFTAGTVFHVTAHVPEFWWIIAPPDIVSISLPDHFCPLLQSSLSRIGREQSDGVIRHYYAVLLEG